MLDKPGGILLLVLLALGLLLYWLWYRHKKHDNALVKKNIELNQKVRDAELDDAMREAERKAKEVSDEEAINWFNRRSRN